jgi:hypothetical protein
MSSDEDEAADEMRTSLGGRNGLSQRTLPSKVRARSPNGRGLGERPEVE